MTMDRWLLHIRSAVFLPQGARRNLKATRFNSRRTLFFLNWDHAYFLPAKSCYFNGLLLVGCQWLGLSTPAGRSLQWIIQAFPTQFSYNAIISQKSTASFCSEGFKLWRALLWLEVDTTTPDATTPDTAVSKSDGYNYTGYDYTARYTRLRLHRYNYSTTTPDTTTPDTPTPPRYDYEYNYTGYGQPYRQIQLHGYNYTRYNLHQIRLHRTSQTWYWRDFARLPFHWVISASLATLVWVKVTHFWAKVALLWLAKLDSHQLFCCYYLCWRWSNPSDSSNVRFDTWDGGSSWMWLIPTEPAYLNGDDSAVDVPALSRCHPDLRQLLLWMRLFW